MYIFIYIFSNKYTESKFRPMNGIFYFYTLPDLGQFGLFGQTRSNKFGTRDDIPESDLPSQTQTISETYLSKGFFLPVGLFLKTRDLDQDNLHNSARVKQRLKESDGSFSPDAMRCVALPYGATRHRTATQRIFAPHPA